ncbi:MAG TPA: DUF5362 family protein, partial [Mucilaginibacter sp.]
MEITDLTEQSASGHLPGLSINEEAKYFLLQSGKWASFLGVVGFILTGFITLVALFIGSILSIVAKFQPTPTASKGGGLITICYLGIALVHFFFSLYLYQFGTRIKSGVLFNNEMEVTSAMGKLKSFFKLWGIITIVVIALYALIIIGIIIAIPTLQRSGITHTLTYVK